MDLYSAYPDTVEPLPFHSMSNYTYGMNEKYPDVFTIADAKRGDIGNTSSMYAKAFFDDLGFDSVTVAPDMGKDEVEPLLAFANA